MNLTVLGIRRSLQNFFEEDGIFNHLNYWKSLPQTEVEGHLLIKQPCLLSGTDWFIECFRYLGAEAFDSKSLRENEGKLLDQGKKIFVGKLPFNLALTGERLALNLLQHSTSVSTTTHKFVEKSKKYGISILDTRKTTPGLRALEKDAVLRGGGINHRFNQTDLWMVKDNHKVFFGGITPAVNFFKEQKSQYTPLLVETQTIAELKEAMELGVRHIMLDNFEPAAVREAIGLKKEGVTFEISGGITLENIDSYLIEGVDAISIGCLTHTPTIIDLSFKYHV